jgi:hypothetical protein
MTTKTKENTMNKIIEYMSVIMATVGTLAMVGAVGSIEIDKYLQGASMALIGIVSYILALYAQELYKEDK